MERKQVFLRNDFANYYKTAIFILMAILMIVFIGKIADIAITFFVAFIISASVLPVINKLASKMPRGLAVSLILLLLFAGILLIVIPLAMLTVNQFALILSDIPNYFDKTVAFINSQKFHEIFSQYIDSSNFETIGQNLSTFAGNILSQGLSAGKIIANSITSIVMVVITVFYLCVDEEHMKKSYLSFFPPKFKKKANEILDIITTKVGGYVLAQISVMAVVGIMTFIGLLIVHHPQALLIGFLTFVLDIVPVVGPAIALIIGALAALNGGVGYVILVLFVMGLAQWVESQFVRPYLFGKFMDMHPLLIIISLLIGAKFLGVMGVILGPAFASLVCVLVNELYIKQINAGGKLK